MDDQNPELAPDTKDWTWVIHRPCPDCGFEADDYTFPQFGTVLRETVPRYLAALQRPDATRRGRPDTWSVLEYAAHVRDVHRTFTARLELMLAEDNPSFENWDQDEAAREDRYHAQDPGVVAEELRAATFVVSDLYDDVPDSDWDRTGVRSNGSTFTVETLGQYHLHDVVHHLWDIDA